jgi:hypothetical protein
VLANADICSRPDLITVDEPFTLKSALNDLAVFLDEAADMRIGAAAAILLPRADTT